MNSQKEASQFTKLSNQFEAIRLNINQNGEYDLASCGCCTTSGDVVVPLNGSANAGAYWDQEDYNFLQQDYDIEEHASVNPSLWTNGRNNQINGLFTVLEEKIYQVRGYDMANITFVRTKGSTDAEGNTQPAGWIIFDTLMSKECTYAAMSLADQYFCDHLGTDYELTGRIRGIVISHTHVDHFGGMNAVIYYNNGCKSVEEETDTGLVHSYKIYVPAGFVQHSVSENVYAGNAMARRASYQYGNFIKPGKNEDISINTKRSISIGIGQGQSLGTPSFNSDVYEIEQNTTICIDGLNVEFQLTPGTEAPAEMNNFIEEYEALWLAENCSGTLHNLYTLRGAQVRDGNAWAKYLMEAAELFGDKTQVIFQAHNWPHWSQQAIEENEILNNKAITATDIKDFIIDTAAIYKYINDQSLLYMNEGYKMEEVAQKIRIPEKLARNWCLRPYYGTPYHDSKAVYQKYLGFYDANPVNLNPISFEERAKKYMEYMGDVQSILDKAYADYEKGNYRFVAEITNLIVFSGNDDSVIVNNEETTASEAARYLCADALEQLGYTAESGIWRNAYLSGAYELRNIKERVSSKTSSDLIANMDGVMLLDYIGILFDGDKGAHYKFSFTIEIKVDDDEKSEIFKIELRHGVLLYYRDDTATADFAIEKNDLLLFLERVSNPDYDKLKEDLTSCMIKGDTISEETFNNCVDYMNTIIDNLTNLQIDRYKYFDIVQPRNYDVKVKVSSDENGTDNYEYCKLRDKVASCAGMFEAYYESMKEIENDTIVTLDNEDQGCWINKSNDGTVEYGYYNILVVQTGVFEDGKFFTQIPVYNGSHNNDGIGPDCQFRKYEYAHILYECYKYLAEPYWNGAEGDDDEILYIRQAIKLVEPYVTLFRHREGGVDNSDILSFEDSDMEAWKYLYPILGEMNILDSEFFQTDETDETDENLGVGADGEFYGRDLVHLTYQLYKYLYEKKNTPILIDIEKNVVCC